MSQRQQLPTLSERDVAILEDLFRVRLLTGRQLERLHFSALATRNASASARRRSLGRLVAARLVTTLPRRVGGERTGSAGLVYALDARALRLRELWLPDTALPAERVRRPWSIGWLFVQHTLDVSEAYVRLRERQRITGERLLRFDAEPASWYAGSSGSVKPDAYAVYEAGPWELHRWLEVDRATESLPTLSRKLRGYLELARADDRGPAGVLPRVVVTVPTEHRRRQVARVIAALPGPAADLICVEPFSELFVAAARPPP